MERADDPTLEDAPKTLNRIRVYGADHVSVRGVPHPLMRVVSVEVEIDAVLIGRQQADFVQDRFAHERFGCFLGDALKHAGDDVALPAVVRIAP